MKAKRISMLGLGLWELGFRDSGFRYSCLMYRAQSVWRRVPGVALQGVGFCRFFCEPTI